MLVGHGRLVEFGQMLGLDQMFVGLGRLVEVDQMVGLGHIARHSYVAAGIGQMV